MNDARVDIQSQYLDTILHHAPPEIFEGTHLDFENDLFGGTQNSQRFVQFVSVLEQLTLQAQQIHLGRMGLLGEYWKPEGAMTGVELLAVGYRTVVESGLEDQVLEIARSWLLHEVESRANEERVLRGYLAEKPGSGDTSQGFSSGIKNLLPIGGRGQHRAGSEISADQVLLELAKSFGVVGDRKQEREFAVLDTENKIRRISVRLLWAWFSKYQIEYRVDEILKTSRHIAQISRSQLQSIGDAANQPFKLGLVTCLVNSPFETNYATYWHSQANLAMGRLLRILGRSAFFVAAVQMVIQTGQGTGSIALDYWENFFNQLAEGQLNVDRIQELAGSAAQHHRDSYLYLVQSLGLAAQTLDSAMLWQQIYNSVAAMSQGQIDYPTVCARWTKQLSESLIHGTGVSLG